MMNKRNHVRYGSELLPGSLSNVAISWGGSSLVGSCAVNYCSNGISVVMPATAAFPDTPKAKESIRVFLPAGDRWFTGECIYVNNEPDGSVTMGISFYNPDEQHYLKDLIFNSLNVPTAHSYVSYEWEELVTKLCDSEDPELQKIGHHHLAIIQSRQETRRYL